MLAERPVAGDAAPDQIRQMALDAIDGKRLRDLIDPFERALWLSVHEPGIGMTCDELARRAA